MPKVKDPSSDNITTVYAKYVFSAQEKAEKAIELADAVIELEHKVNEKKAVNQQMTADLAAVTMNTKLLSAQLRDGFEMRMQRCKLELDKVHMQRIFRHPDTLEIIKVEPARPDDFQLSMYQEGEEPTA